MNPNPDLEPPGQSPPANPDSPPAQDPDPEDSADCLSLEQLFERYYEDAPTARVWAEVAGLTDRGKVRATNEDHYMAVKRYRGREVLSSSLLNELSARPDDLSYMMAVADGMGGRQFGEFASLLALRTGWELGGREIKWPVKVNDRETTELIRKVGLIFQIINKTLQLSAQEDPKLAGMGTTLTGAYSTGPDLFVFHAGDSRAYLHSQGTLKLLTRDHNLAQVLVDAGAAAPGSPEARKVRHVLTNCLGAQSGAVEVDACQERLRHGDRVLLCTDGLVDMVEDEAIASVLDKAATPADACRDLMNLALDRGAKDNVTVVIAQYFFDEA